MADRFKDLGQLPLPPGFFGKPGARPSAVPDGAPGPLYPPKYGHVRLRTFDKALDVEIRLDDESSALVPQLPRIETVDIPWRASRTWWSGQSGATLQIPCVFDGFPRQSVEGKIAIVEEMARPVAAGKASGRPSPVQVAGNVPGADRAWMLVGIEQGTAMWRNGYRVRQHLVLSLVQWLPLEQADTRGRRNARTSKGAVKRRGTVVVKRGDTLATIAARELGQASRWRDIAKANPVKRGKKSKARTSPTDVKVGERLKLPNG